MSLSVAEADPFAALAEPLQEPTRKLAAVLASSPDTCAVLVPPELSIRMPYYLGAVTGNEVYDYDAESDPFPPGTLESALVRPARIGGEPYIVGGSSAMLVDYFAYAPLSNVSVQGVAPEHDVRSFLDVATSAEPERCRDAFRALAMAAIKGCAGPDEGHAMENPHYVSPLSLQGICATVEATWAEIPEDHQFALVVQ